MPHFVDSWKFIRILTGLFVSWLIVNSLPLPGMPVAPSPFTLLHLALTFLAPLQAPIILRSQNREEERERRRGEDEYRINHRAEIEIRRLHAKMDQLLTNQWQRMLEIQQIQTDLMQGIARQNVEEVRCSHAK